MWGTRSPMNYNRQMILEAKIGNSPHLDNAQKQGEKKYNPLVFIKRGSYDTKTTPIRIALRRGGRGCRLSRQAAQRDF